MTTNPTIPTLRPYQVKDLESIRAAFRKHQRVLLTQPCGSGKGTLASYIIHAMHAKSETSNALFLVNRRTLVFDMSERLDRLGIEHGIIMGGVAPKPWLRTQIASIDTVNRRESVPPADLIIMDECRFAMGDIWKKVLARYPKTKVLGLDATPERTDGQGLGHIFEYMVVGPQVEELIALGHLVPSTLFRSKETPDVKGVRGDKQIAEICCGSTIVGDVVETWHKRAQGLKTVCFACDKNHAHILRREFDESGVECDEVFDDTPDKERAELWHRLDHGTLKVLLSVGVVSYGWDHPIISCVIDAAPTSSVSRAIQRWGRGARPYPGKTSFVLLDHAGNTHEHGLYEDHREWRLDGPALGDSKNESVTMCRKCFCTFRSGPDVCPHCGADIPKRIRQVNVIDEDLELYRRQQLLDNIHEGGGVGPAFKYLRTSEADKERRYRQLVAIAASRGYKPKWADVNYKNEFGQWPSKWIAKDKRRYA
jgi:DNA repair protein RadD